MFKSISRIIIAGTVMVTVQPALSMEIYTVKSNDYLYKIAKNHSVEGISASELKDAIKEINKSEISGIIDNRIKIGDKLTIPTTKSEVKDGLTLTRNKMIQGSYDQDDSSKESEVLENSSEQNLYPSVTSQDKISALIPTEDGQAETLQTYKNDLSSSINSDNVEETQSYDEEITPESSFLGSLFKLVVYLMIFAGLAFLARRFWDSRNSKKEQKLKIISKRKRDHLMSRISPVVSDSNFYGTQKGPQE